MKQKSEMNSTSTSSAATETSVIGSQVTNVEAAAKRKRSAKKAAPRRKAAKKKAATDKLDWEGFVHATMLVTKKVINSSGIKTGLHSNDRAIPYLNS